MNHINQDVEEILLGEEEIASVCDRIAAQITEDYKNSKHPLVFIVILKGSIFFATDLIRRVPLPSSIEFMKVSSYGSGSETSGFIQVQLDLKGDITDADVIVIEDIIDSGRTLEKLTALLSDRGAHSVKCCALLDKPDRRQVDFCADYVGRKIPDKFVVGYGLDYDERYRGLPYVGVLKPCVYEK